MSDAEYVQLVHSVNNPWYADEAEKEAWSQCIRQFNNERKASLAFQRRKKNSELLIPIFVDMVYGHDLHVDFGPWSDKRISPLLESLRSYCPSFHMELSNQPPTLGSLEKVHKSVFRDAILDACIAARTPYKVGASLYAFQQIADRGLVTEPSLSKALWIVAYAPLTETESTLRKDGGSHEQIGKEWKHYFRVAHYWAAYAVMCGTPLRYEDSSPLNFVCHANADQFFRMAAAFLEFRKRIKVTFAKREGQELPYIKQGIDWTPDELAHAISPTEIPDLLEPYQWDVVHS